MTDDTEENECAVKTDEVEFPAIEPVFELGPLQSLIEQLGLDGASEYADQHAPSERERRSREAQMSVSRAGHAIRRG